jgi:hypothetical protein
VVYPYRGRNSKGYMQEIITVDKKEAVEVLQEVDKLIHEVEEATSRAGDSFIDLSLVLLKVKRGAYWTERGYKSEHEYIEKAFPQSRAQYYKLLRFGINLQGYKRELLKKWGVVKCEGLVRLHTHFEGQVPSEWFQALDNDNKETFVRRIRAYFESLEEKDRKQVKPKDGEPTEDTEPETEDSFITLRIFGNDIHTWNRAMECAGQELGSDKSISYRVMMILNDYLAGFTEDGKGRSHGENSFLLSSIANLVKQLNFNVPNTSEMLIGLIAKAVEENAAS